MSVPTIAIVGRPNVGKSALFNRICKKRIAIVDEAEGITRDRIYGEAECFGTPFRLVDTGGIDPRSRAPFNEQVKAQAELAIAESDALIMVVDVQIGITTLDEELAQILLRTKKPVILAVNKVDHQKLEAESYSFHALGISEVIPVSASHGGNIAELCQAALDRVEEAGESDEVKGIKVAIVGRPNVGKSSLINTLLHDERCIVSPIAGTTRDSIDIHFTSEGEQYTLIDTAGIRRKKSEHEVVDKFAAIRTERAISRCDVCLLMLDSQQGMTTQDKKIAQEIERAGKGCIILFNKWDLTKGFRMEHAMRDIEENVSFLHHCPKVFISAETGRNLEAIFPLVQKVYTDWKERISTHALNKLVTEAMQSYHPPMIRGKRLRVYYLTQSETCPPRMILFVNYPELMTTAYKRYLYNQLRKKYPFVGCPLILNLKQRARKERADRNAKDLLQNRHQAAALEKEKERIADLELLLND
jgi:GTP-binding protein